MAQGGHVCWSFNTDEALHDAAATFLVEGAARHERLVYVAEGTCDRLRADLAAMPDVDRLVASGCLTLQPVGDLYEPDGSFDVARQVATYRALIENARREGFSGLRVAANATSLVAGNAARRRFLRYELVVDEVMAKEPMTALCAYDRRVVGDAIVELGAVHPLRHGLDGCADDFHAYSSGDALHLAGEIDVSTSEVFDIVLDVARSKVPATIVLDVSSLTFIDCRGLAALGRLATTMRDAGGEVEVRGASPALRRWIALLGLDDLVMIGSPA